jgi:hypothetical protein
LQEKTGGCGLPLLPCRGGLGGGAIAPVEGALLVMPGGAFGMINLAVMVGVDPVETLAEAAVAVGLGEPGEPIVIGFDGNYILD